MLDIFKQEKSFLTRAKEKSSLKYVIKLDDVGAFVEVCDSKLKVIKDIDYRVYNGIDREILQLLENSSERDFFTVSWESEENHLYLDKHPRLLELLRQNGKIFVDSGDEISFESGVFKVELEILKDENSFATSINIDSQTEFRFLTSNYMLLSDKIVQVFDIGENFSRLKDFNTTINDDKLEEYLTILFTHFENIDIKYENYEVEFKDEKRLIKPAVIFEKITSDNELILRTSATVGKLSPEFFNDFNISKIVLINELESTISIYECDFSDVFEIYGTIFSK
ncbi:MAG: hypothetical protein U9P72_06305, partial [Campylobacterota bacterium]|nr:hypothetical protein [Campylobacterota bacterium]